MADDFDSELSDPQLAQTLRADISSIESGVEKIATDIEANDRDLDHDDLDGLAFEVLELLHELGDTLGPGLELTDTDRTTDDYQYVADTALELIDHLDAEVETGDDSGEDTGGATIEHTPE